MLCCCDRSLNEEEVEHGASRSQFHQDWRNQVSWKKWLLTYFCKMSATSPAAQEMQYKGIPERWNNSSRPRDVMYTCACVCVCVCMCVCDVGWGWDFSAGTIEATLKGHNMADLTLYLLGNGVPSVISRQCCEQICILEKHSGCGRKDALEGSRMCSPEISREVVKATQARND